MRGSLRRRGDDSWEIRLSLGKSMTTGRWLQKSVTVHGTKKDADREMRKLLHSLANGTYVEPEKVTVGEFCERWLRDYIKPSGRAERTRRTYELIIRKHVTPVLGHIPLQRLTPAHLQRYYADKRASGSLGNSHQEKGTALSATTVAHHHAVIHEALEHAMREGLISRNVAEASDPPKITRNEMKTWTSEDVRRFLAAAKGDRHYALFLAAITTGMRQGELLGLRWLDLDLEAGLATIQQSLNRAGSTPVFGRPKTERSRRQIVLLPVLVEALRFLQVTQSAERLNAGNIYRDFGLVFTVPGGAPIAASNMYRRHFLPLLAKAGVPRIRFHDLRHTHATLLMIDGVNPKIVAERLGHTGVAITLDLYSHATTAMQQDAVDGYRLNNPGAGLVGCL
jgi:integrase